MALAARHGARKRSSIIAGEIRSRIITDGLDPGDSLPIEKLMIEDFGASRATIREALKELEVQGLIRMKTGPNGGPIVAGSSPLEALQAIRNFCYFEKVTIHDIYELRSALEVQMVQSAASSGRDRADVHMSRRPRRPRGSDWRRRAE